MEYALSLQKLIENGNEALELEADDAIDGYNLPDDFQEDDPFHKSFVLAVYRKGINSPSIKHNLKRHKEFKKYFTVFEQRFGNDAWCYFPKDILFDVRDNKFDYDLFSLICAVGSCIPTKYQYRHITKDQIAVRMKGCKTEKIRNELFSRRYQNSFPPDLAPKTELMHPKKVERLRNEACERGFFRCYTYRQRTTYYSTKLGQKELVQAVLKSKDRSKKNALEIEEAEVDHEEEMNRRQEAVESRKRRLLLKVVG